MNLELIPIIHDEERMKKYLEIDFCMNVFGAFNTLYARVGYHVPWIGYFAMIEDDIVGTGGFKGPPESGQIEIAYGVIPEMEGRGVATKICQRLTQIALIEDAKIRITARTLMEHGASTRILNKNGFRWIGIVEDSEDGQVWEWEFVAR